MLPVTKQVTGWESPVVGPYEGAGPIHDINLSGSAKLTGNARFETADLGPYEDMLPRAKKVSPFETPDVGPYEVEASGVNRTARFETPDLDAMES